MTLYLGAAASFLVWVGMSMLGAKMLHLSGPEWYIFVGLLSALGLTACAVFIYFKTKFQGGGEAASTPATADGGSTEVEQLLRMASAKVSQSSVTQGQTIANLPLIFVIGDQGTAKTTSILHSGLEPELLAGQVYQQNEIAATRTANVWYARGFAFVEAGGAVLGDPGNWARLVKNLQPGKLKSLVGKGGQAPRAVLLCVSLEAFLAPGASGALEAASRYLNARLGEISQILGISYPVYVLFTKADRLPFFVDYVHRLSDDEAGQVFGATLPMRDLATGVYAEEETHRLTAAFNNLFSSLCDNRIVYLPREDDAVKVPGAYEFPREFRKLRSGVIQLLVDVCRPSQLRSSPFLRGFYFSGVRPVVLSDVALAQSARSSPQQHQSLEEAGGATRMFRVGVQEERLAQQSLAQPQSTARKVPQWTFLTHLFNGLIMQDAAAMGASVSSVKTSVLRRVLLGVAAGLCLLLALLFTVSYFGNRALENEALSAARNITGADSSEPVLRRLETLRQSLQKLAGYERDGHPFSLALGLYSGSRILPDVRNIYFNKFKQVLFGETQNSMLAFMRGTPAAPGPTDEYGPGYDTLKAYLLTAPEYKRTSDTALQAFLGNSLWTRWRHGKEDTLTKERSDLAKKQFEFYSAYLHEYNPYPNDGDKAAIERTRLYLSKFSGVDRTYQSVLTEVAKGHPPTSFNDAFPGSVAVVTSTQPIAFAYTKQGSDMVLKSIHDAKFGGEPWVLGNYQAQTVDKAAMEQGLLDLYSRDYIKQWRAVLQKSRVNPYTDWADASTKLNTLTGSEAPLLALFWWASKNTAVDVPGVKTAFASVQQVAPPSTVPQYVGPANQVYNNGLIKLQSAVEAVAKLPAPDPTSAAATIQEANLARTATRGITSTFPPDPVAHMQDTVNELMLKPITYVEDLGKPRTADANAKAKAFCAAMDPVTRKFPFNPAAVPEVTLDELNALFKPKEGKLAQFEEALKPYVVCTGGECAPAPATPAPVDPRFLAFVKQATAFSHALYAEGGAGPSFSYTLRPLPSEQIDEFVLTVNGDAAHLNPGGQRSYVWPGAGTPGFRVDWRLAGNKTPLEGAPFNTLWGVFRFFVDADSTARSGAGYKFTWIPRQGKGDGHYTVNNRQLSYDFFVDTNGAPAVFSKDFLAGMKCVPVVAH